MFAALDLAGIGVFAASGAFAAVRARLGVFAVVALGVTTGLGGGVAGPRSRLATCASS